MSRVRPTHRRRTMPPEELAALAGMDVAELERRLRGMGKRLASWHGSGWVLSDPGWQTLLGLGYDAKLARHAGLEPRAQASKKKRPRRWTPPPGKRRDIQIVASFWGEDV